MVWKATRIAGVSPLPVSEHSVTTVAEKFVFVFGGVSATRGVTNDLGVINTGGLKNWAQLTIRGAPPPPRKGHSSTLIQHNNKDHLFIFGGTDGKSHSFNDSYLLHSETYAWSKPRCTGTLPLPRANHTAVAVDNHNIIVFGGRYLVRPLDDCYQFTNGGSKNEWTVMKTQGSTPAARYSHAATVWRNQMVVFGGTDGKSVFGDVHVLDLNSSTWRQASVTGSIPPRSGAGHALVDNQFFVFGGDGPSGPLNDVYYLDLETMTWNACEESTLREGDEVPPHSGHGFSLVGKTLLYAVGGSDTSSGVYILDTKRFQPIPVDSGDSSAPVNKRRAARADEGESDSPVPEPSRPTPTVAAPVKETPKVVETPAPAKPSPAAVTRQPSFAATPAATTPSAAAAPVSPRAPAEDSTTKAPASSTGTSNLLQFATLMEEKSKELTEVKARLGEVENQLAAQRRRADAAEQELDRSRSAQGAGDAARVEVESLRQTNQSLQERLEKATAASGKDRSEKQEVEAALRAKTREAEAAENSLKAEKATLARVQQQNSEIEEKLKSVSKEAEVSRLRVQQLEEAERGRQVGAGADKAKEQETAESLAALQREVALLRVDVADKTATLSAKQIELGRVTEELASARATAEATRAVNDEAGSKHKEEVAALTEQLAEALARNKAAEELRASGADSLQAIIREREAQAQQASAQLAEVRRELEQETSRRQAAEKQRDEAKQQADEQVRKIQESGRADQSALAALREELKQWKGRAEDAEAANAEITKRQAGAKEESAGEIERLVGEIARLTGEVQRLSADVAGQIKKNEAEVSMRKELEKRLVEAKGASSSAPSQQSSRVGVLEKQLEEKQEQIAQLEGEVEQWMVASEQLQKLGEEAVREVTEEADSLREEVNVLTKKYEDEVRRRRDVEGDLASSEQKLQELDTVLGRLMSMGK